MRRWAFGAFAVLSGMLIAGTTAGCGNPYVTVDTRLTDDTQLWNRLDGPRYAVVADDPRLQAALAFEDSAATWGQVLVSARPGIRRVSDARQADLVFTLNFNITDLGTGINTYPVYGWSRGYFVGCGGRGYGYAGREFVGTEVETYHRGFLHTLFLSAWIADASQPAGRRVIWEGQADRTTDEADLKAAMPYLARGLGHFYGQATSKPTRIKIDKDELPAPVSAIPATSRPS